MAAAAPIAMGLMVAGQVGAGIDANNAGRAQGRVLDENARLAELAGEQEALQSRREERRMAGAMIAAMGGSGVGMGDGTSYDLVMESAVQREMEIMNLRARAAGEASNLRMQANDKRAAGRAALVGSIFGAASTALNGVADMRRQKTLDSQWERERERTRPPRMSSGGS